MYLLNVALFSIVYSGDPTTDDIHDDAFVPAAAVFNSIPGFAGIHTVLAALLSLSLLLCLRSCCCERS